MQVGEVEHELRQGPADGNSRDWAATAARSIGRPRGTFGTDIHATPGLRKSKPRALNSEAAAGQPVAATGNGSLRLSSSIASVEPRSTAHSVAQISPGNASITSGIQDGMRKEQMRNPTQGRPRDINALVAVRTIDAKLIQARKVVPTRRPLMKRLTSAGLTALLAK